MTVRTPPTPAVRYGLLAAGLALLLVCPRTAGAQKAADPEAGLVKSAGTLPSASPDVQRLDKQLDDAWAIDMAAQPAKAQAAFEQVRVEAERLGLTRQVAGALRGMAGVESAQERNVSAKTLVLRARELYRVAGDELGEARATRQLGGLTCILGDHEQGLRLLYQARDTFARLDDKRDLAFTYYNIVYQLHDETRDGVVADALAAARAAGLLWVECSVRHSYGDGLFSRGDYAAAYPELTAALACYEKTDKVGDKGRVLVSLGRVERAHGQYERALAFYQKAYAIQQEAHDEPAAIQSLNAIGVAYSYMDRLEDARKCYEEALERSKALGSERFIAFMTANLGNVYAELGQYTKGLELLQQGLALEKNAGNRITRHWQIASVLANLDRLDEALASVNQAVTLADDDRVRRINALALRAGILQRLNRLDASDADLQEALGLIEEVRGKTLAQDFMKRGFSESTQAVFAAAIDVRTRRGDARGALAFAEQARSRAFLDLLASRRTEPTAVGLVASTEAMAPQNGIPVGFLSSPAPAASTADAVAATSLPTRGAGGDPVAPYMSSPTPALDIASTSSAVAPTPDEMIATAARLRSTLLVYWVGYQSTVAWVITPAGQIHSRTIPVEPKKLSELARATTSLLKDNGAGLAFITAAQAQPWRDLYQLLIKPVREYLPTTPGSLLTIVPHGPLFQVSFAGLQAEDGRYLIESYRLHYTPSIGVLAYTTAEARQRLMDPAAKALLVGDPAPPATDPGDEDLAALPWARREVTEIGSIIGARRADVITEGQATEAHVREEIEGANLLHFATHGVIRQSEAMSSFLALARPDDGHGIASAVSPASRRTDALTDGKLTADEVYGLRLHADLVVLSACGTALGPMSGDGVIGFTRAFLYAGARSVIATEWNVPDQTGYEVMKRFYRFRKASHDTSDALREAQLSVLGALRTGKLRVETPGGTVALRENPLFWAGFVLVGRP